jgi:uncharacterized cofD-like protein
LTNSSTPTSSTLNGGPRVVALGGGHGLAASLRAARLYAGEVTAVVSVADDGGSSGRLRDAFGIPAPGDLRRCLVALGTDERWRRALEHRFEAGELEGHALGNLLIAGLTSATGDFLGALDEAGRLVGAVGRVLPATTIPVILKAVVAGAEVEGQVRVQHNDAGRIDFVSLVPPDAEAPPEVLEAIDRADQVILGPGSLYTSVLAVVAVPDIAAALATCPALKVYVCNLRTEQETSGYDAADHLAALHAHGVRPDVVVHDPEAMPPGAVRAARVVTAALALPDDRGHDPARLADVLGKLVR